mmetsp:Transcript_22270/g.32380  ORF Transcript_22270/g.32380 Transcript_22270/m.32380 type:complete len:580 (-) Transcript_22270:394-2133(-)
MLSTSTTQIGNDDNNNNNTPTNRCLFPSEKLDENSNDTNSDDDDDDDEEDISNDDDDDKENNEDLTASINIALTAFNAVASPLSIPTTYAFRSSSSQKEEDGASKSPTPLLTNVTKCYLSPSCYRERLMTFRNVVNYFAKPNMLSPLICARFGWTNTSKDILKCSHPKCNATICISFHPKLSSTQRYKLTCTYRRMLATSHSKNCPFRTDAERWLRNYDSSSSSSSKKPNDYIVPPHLLPMTKEFQIFEDGSYNFDVAKHAIYEKATELDEDVVFPFSRNLEREEEFQKKFCMMLPKEVMDWYSCMFETDEDGGNGGDWSGGGRIVLATALSLRIRNAILNCMDNNDDDSCSSDEDDNDEADENETVPTSMSAVLAAFGWSPPREKKNIENDEHGSYVSVQCQICLAKALISLRSNEGRQRQRHGKRKRGDEDSCVEEEEVQSKNLRTNDRYTNGCSTTLSLEEKNEISINHLERETVTNKIQNRETCFTKSEFNLVHSHRFFCPYVCGFDAHMDDSSCTTISRLSDGMMPTLRQPGWKIVLEKLLCKEKAQSLVKHGVGGKGDMAFYLIQDMLRGSNF